MSSADLEDRPSKKRRFFQEDSSLDKITSDELVPSTLATSSDAVVAQPSSPLVSDAITGNRDGGFDIETLKAFVGEDLPESTIERLKSLSGDDVERAINIHLDGSWKSYVASPRPTGLTTPHVNGLHTGSPSASSTTAITIPTRRHSREKRYLGALGVTGWATRSGSELIKYGEKVQIERAKNQSASSRTGRGGRLIINKRQDVVVRFANVRGEEIGRLESDSAAWISTLLDQRTCHLEGICVFAPDRVRTNDSIYLQLHCFILHSAFETGGFKKPVDSNRRTGIFEVKESLEERDLRLRQVALVKLFEQLNLQPMMSNDQVDEAVKRQGLLIAAEKAEQNESSVAKAPENGASSPPSDDAEEGEELEQDQLDALYKKAQSFDFDTPEAEPAETFALTLRRYQRQALHWMMGKEKDVAGRENQSMHPLWDAYEWPTKDVDGNDLPNLDDQDNFYVNPYSGEMSLDFPVQEQNCLGGILADEMGLGKTIEMLSLIHSHKPEISSPLADFSSVNDLTRLRKSSAITEWAPATTLVVAPMSLLAQWQSEAEKASKSGSLNVLMYYGNEKNIDLRGLCCESNASPAPNVIITSYGVVLSEFNQVVANGGDRSSLGGLFSLEYLRIILDEAHFIKNRQSKTAKACYDLKARHRWVLTGTPIVNRLEDLFSLVHFLKVEPWSNFSFWKTFITVPFEAKEFIRALDVVQTVLEPLVLRRTKDMKTPDGQSLVPLPPKTIHMDKIELSKPEREVYDYIFTRAKRTFAANVEAGTLLKSYSTIFAQILRLRQSCCHPLLTRNKNIVTEEEDAAAAADMANGLADDMDLEVLIERFKAESDEQDANRYGAHVLKQIMDESSDECPICSEEPMQGHAVTGCWHSACKQCLLDYIEHQRSKGHVPRCFNCREPINSRDVFQVIRNDSEDNDHRQNPFHIATGSKTSARVSLRRVGSDSSAKISRLMSHLKKMKTEDPMMKCVVFSQFTSFLDLIEPALERDGISFLRFDGTMAQKQRAAVLEEFTNREKSVVLLLSLRAGGVGLNLTAAKRVFMMDPWWSFAVEAQAIDRVHRMGQDSEVVVTRFIVEGSIEEKMLRIQERKKFLASSLGMMSNEEKKLQRIEDIKELLS